MGQSFMIIVMVFSAVQLLSLVALLVFIKPATKHRFKPPKNHGKNDDDDDDGWGDVSLDDIVLPPIDGIDYPSEIEKLQPTH